MDVVFFVGKTFVVALVVFSGITFHFTQTAVQYAKAAGSPSPETLVPLSGVAFIVGGISVVFGILGDVGALLLIATLAPITWYMHAFWKEEDQARQIDQMNNFMKNVGIIGGLLVLFWTFNQLQGEAPVSLTDPLFDRW